MALWLLDGPSKNASARSYSAIPDDALRGNGRVRLHGRPALAADTANGTAKAKKSGFLIHRPHLWMSLWPQ